MRVLKWARKYLPLHRVYCGFRYDHRAFTHVFAHRFTTCFITGGEIGVIEGVNGRWNGDNNSIGLTYYSRIITIFNAGFLQVIRS